MTVAIAAAVALLIASLVLVAVWVASGPSSPSSGDLRLRRLADDVYVFRHFFSCSAVFVLPRSVVVVDTGVSPRAGRQLREAIATVTDRPVTHVINTHYHGDHSGGNVAFPGAEIIATEETARYVVERDSERVEYAQTFGLVFQELHPTIPPTRTFRNRLDLDVEGERIEVLQLGGVETPDACVVHWPGRRVVACGDGIATHDYPYLGVPFLDEGLAGDGEWLGFLRRVRELAPEVLIAGHGPPIVGAAAIRERIALLERLFTDLLVRVGRYLDEGLAPPAIRERVASELAHYVRRRDLRQSTTGQDFAIYRCINNLDPTRKGRGWWDDLRPSVMRSAAADDVERELAGCDGPAAVHTRALALLPRDRALGESLLARWTSEHADDARGLALLADIYFDSARGITPRVDGTEYIAAAIRCAEAAKQADPGEPLALLNYGSARVFGGMVLAQPMDEAVEALERALAAPGLTAAQRRKGWFFLAKAHQMELRDAEADRCFRHIVPAPLRWLFPLLRARLRAYPS